MRIQQVVEFYERKHFSEGQIPGPDCVIRVHATETSPASFAECPKSAAATFVAQGVARLASPEETREFLEKRQAASAAENARQERLRQFADAARQVANEARGEAAGVGPAK